MMIRREDGQIKGMEMESRERLKADAMFRCREPDGNCAREEN